MSSEECRGGHPYEGETWWRVKGEMDGTATRAKLAARLCCAFPATPTLSYRRPKDCKELKRRHVTHARAFDEVSYTTSRPRDISTSFLYAATASRNNFNVCGDGIKVFSP